MVSSARKSEPKSTSKRRKVDWPAVERDYRTSQMTLRELGDKHGCDHAAIARKAKSGEWARDLTAAVKQATNSKLIEHAVNKAVTSSQQTVTNAVLVAAEINKQVILGHRDELQSSRLVASSLLQELSQAALLATEQELLTQILAGTGAEPVDEARARAVVHKALGLHSRIGSVKSLIESFAKLQASERVAFGLPADGIGQASDEADPLGSLLDLVNGSKLPLAPGK